MKIIGLIGGLGPESTIDYYEKLIAAYRQRKGDDGYPRIVINSVDLTRIIALVSAARYEELAEELASEVERLANADADFEALTANTPRVVFDHLERRSPIPIVSIVRTACDATIAAGVRRPLLMGTRFTMAGRFYPDVFSRAGVEIVIPSAADQEFIHEST